MTPTPPLLRRDLWATLAAHGRDFNVGRPDAVESLMFWVRRAASASIDVFDEADDDFMMLIATCIINPAAAAVAAASPDWSPT